VTPVPDADNPDPFIALADRIRANTTRPVFEDLFDRAMEPLMDQGVEGATPFKALSTLRDSRRPLPPGDEKDRADIALALRRANDLQLLGPLVATNFEKLFGKAAGDGDAPAAITVDLQAIANVGELFRDPRTATSGGAAAQRRCCRIACEIDGQPDEKGSGFLIGPHLVLTNYHVVRSQIGPDGRPRDGSRDRITVTFDALGDAATPRRSYRPAERWLLDFSSLHPDDTVAQWAAEPGAQAGINQAAAPLDRWPQDPAALADHLDYAIIELDATPGYERGWYALDASRWPRPNTSVSVYQFPFGLVMAYTQGEVADPPRAASPFAFPDPGKPARILHTANTVRGSSGGVCLDSGLEAFGLHQAACRFRPGRDNSGHPVESVTLNVAIPLALIAQRSGARVRDSIKAAPAIENWTYKKEPIIGRRALQTFAAATAFGENRIIVIQTSLDPATRLARTKIGKSFSTTILERFLPASDHVLLTVRGARLSFDAYDAARVIMDAIDPSGVAALPPEPERHTSLDADAKARLVDPLVAAMRKAAGNGVFWLVIDDLDRYPINASSTAATLLDALYAAVAIDDRLRIVLIGPTSRPGALAALPAQYEPVLEEHVTDAEVEDWIAVEYGHDRQLTVDVIRLMAKIARSVAKGAAEKPETGPTGAIAAVLRDHVAPCIPPRPL
jgi:hypothetical protein